MKMPQLRWMIPTLLIAPLVLSCASMKTRQDQYAEAVPLAREGAYEQAAALIEASKDDSYREKDRVLYYLDLGMLYHWAGEYEQSNAMLHQAEASIEELFTQSISKALASGILNDNALDYAGEDYEDIYLNVFKALNYIALNDEESALVEIRRVQIKLNLLEDKYKTLIEEYNESEDAGGALEYRENRFHNDVLARYLSLLLYRSEGSYDDARIDLEALDGAWQSQAQIYAFEKPALPVPEHPNNLARVNVLSFSGLGPVKLADTLYLTSGPGIVFINMTGQNDDYVENMLGFTAVPIPGIPPGMHFKIQFPRLSGRGSAADRIVVKLDNQETAELSLLEDMEVITRETYALKRPLTVGKTIIRATTKAVSKEAGKSAMQDSLSEQGVGGLFAGILLGIAADVAVDVTENADLRISHFFPAEAQCAEFDVYPGIYAVTVEYWDGKKLLAAVDHGERVFSTGGLNLIESYVLR